MIDRRIVLTVAIFLGLIVLTSLAGVIWLVDHEVSPEGIALVSGMGGTALGALASLLVSTRTTADPTVNALVDQARATGAAETTAAVLQLDQPAADT